MEVVPLTHALRPAALALLREHKDTSLFLLGNLAAHGAALGPSLSSGNFKCVVEGGAVRAVFVLTRRGNLLAETDRARDYAGPILDACAGEPIAIAGFVGEWSVQHALWRAHAARRPGFRTTAAVREILFRRALGAEDGRSARDPRVRLLAPGDFAVWDGINATFLAERGLPLQGTVEERRAAFLEKVARGHWWGLEEGGALLSMAAYSACVEGVGQVGGVYTVPAERRRGLSRAVMEALIGDGVRVHHLDALVLFTGEDNGPACAMYRALGFAEVGHFALIFGG